MKLLILISAIITTSRVVEDRSIVYVETTVEITDSITTRSFVIADSVPDNDSFFEIEKMQWNESVEMFNLYKELYNVQAEE